MRSSSKKIVCGTKNELQNLTESESDRTDEAEDARWLRLALAIHIRYRHTVALILRPEKNGESGNIGSFSA